MDKFYFKKSMGQNFLKDDNIINKIIKNSDIDSDTLVIEIGPGSGNLSTKIVPLCGYAILYELDERLHDILYERLSSYSNYRIVFGDFLKQKIENLPELDSYKKVYVVANLPYYITTSIITKLLYEIYPDKIVVMVQDEVADRLSANYGSKNYSMITALIASRYDVKKIFKVSRKCFIPMPNVDSAIIEMNKNDGIDNIDFVKLDKFLKDAFKYKRKTLRNNLKNYDLEVISGTLSKFNFSLYNRAEEIPVEVFIDIIRHI